MIEEEFEEGFAEDWGDDFDVPDSLLTNFDRCEKRAAIYRQAAINAGFDVFVSDQVYVRGILRTDLMALHTNERGRDHGPFWREVERLGKDGEGA